MSKRAGAVSAETKERILKSAGDEFFEQGFGGTSLRRISARAGVTTGAIYFFFEGKDDLFEAVISSVTKPFMEYMERHYRQEHSFMDKAPQDNMNEDFAVSRLLIDFYFNNKQIWDILVHHLNHPAVQKFLDSFVDKSTEHYQYLISLAAKKHPRKKPADPFAVHQYVHMQVDTMLTLISHNFNQEEMAAHSRTVTKMLRGAFETLLSD